MCEDNSWTIREACVSAISEISRYCEPTILENDFSSIYLRFLSDKQKWVKIAAYKRLGLFISKLAGRSINEKLFENYLLMIDSNVYNLAQKDEVDISEFKIDPCFMCFLLPCSSSISRSI